MARNKIADLNDHLFAQLERLNDEAVTNPELLELEFKKAKAISQISTQIFKGATLMLQASKAAYSGDVKDLPDTFGVKALGEG